MSDPESPSDALRAHLSKRGWTQRVLSGIIGRPEQWTSDVINGKKVITVESADQLGVAFGTGPGYWLALQDRYRLWVLSQDKQHKARLKEIKRRADQEYPPVRRYQ